jgi:ATP-dependent exoDNAse (exonuclease V) beta subunit
VKHPACRSEFLCGRVKQSNYRFRQADPTLFMGKAKSFSPTGRARPTLFTLNANIRTGNGAARSTGV